MYIIMRVYGNKSGELFQYKYIMFVQSSCKVAYTVLNHDQYIVVHTPVFT